MRRRPFFRLQLNLEAKFWTEIELLGLTKLLKNISLPRNLLNQQNIDAYAADYFQILTTTSTLPSGYRV